VTFFAPPKKVTKERGIPGSPQKTGTDLGSGSVPDFLSPALLDQAGRLRNSRTAYAIPNASGASSQW
jgi:hypothetical protein